VDVDASALRANFLTIRETAGEGARVVPMVKANAYGLGVENTVAALEPLDPWGYGVATVEEGLHLRTLGVEKTVLICSPLPPASYPEAVRGGLTVSISEMEGLRRLSAAALAGEQTGRFHLEIDTGMGRAGLDWREVGSWRTELEELLDSHLSWEGCYTHFYSADGAVELPIVEQWERLQRTLSRLPKAVEGLLVHACNSPGTLRRPDFAADAVRPGIFMYGGVAGEGLPDPEPVASLRARVTLVKEVPAGSTVGYGATYRAQGRETWATVGIGYGDGLPRLLSNRGQGLVHGARAPIIGRISMDVTVLDVTRVGGVLPGDVVTFFGRDGGEGISLEEVAAQADTINYEILTDLTPRLPRIWMNDGGY
jgi:alanine racemase